MATTPSRSSASASAASLESPDRSSRRSPFASLKRFRRSQPDSTSPARQPAIMSSTTFEGSPSLRVSDAQIDLKSPAKIPSPSKDPNNNRGGRSLFPQSPAPGNVDGARRSLSKRPSQMEGLNREMLFGRDITNQQLAATAPARDRKPKRFDLSSWQSHLPDVEPASSPISAQRFSSLTSPVRESQNFSIWSPSPVRRPTKPVSRSRANSVTRPDFGRVSLTQNATTSRLSRSVPPGQAPLPLRRKSISLIEEQARRKIRPLSGMSDLSRLPDQDSQLVGNDEDFQSPSPFLVTPKHRRSASSTAFTRTRANSGASLVPPPIQIPPSHLQSSPTTAGKKRNANGAIVTVNSRGGSMLAAHSPINALHTSSPYTLRSPTSNIFDSDPDSDNDEMGMEVEASPLSPWRSASPPPALTDSSSITSSLASSNSLKSSLSSAGSMGGRKLSEESSIAAILNESNPAFFSPMHYNDVKPLQAVFASTGLVNKQAKARDSGVAFDSPIVLVEKAPQLRLSLAGAPKAMPETPCKQFSAQPLHVCQNARSSIGPIAQNPSPQSSTSGNSDHGSVASTSKPLASPRVGLLRGSGRPSFRRRSSGQLGAEAGFFSLAMNPSDNLEAEPMTPTRVTNNGIFVNVPSLINSPLQQASPLSPLSPTLATTLPPPFCTTPTGQTFPIQLPGSADSVRSYVSNGKGPSRPQFKHRHSGSVLSTVRQQELQQPDRFETNFTVVRPIGKGISSDAVAVASRLTGDVSAVKRTKEAFGGPKDRLRKYEEVAILRMLSRGETSPWIISLVDAWEQTGHLYIQTELCERGNLANFLNEHGALYEKMDDARVWKIAAQLLLGLSFIHKHNIIHLDIKPANIFVNERGNLKYGDFGLASQWPRVSTFKIMEAAAVVSTLWPSLSEIARSENRNDRSMDKDDLEREGDREYIAPEVLNSMYGKPADVFSLGLTLLETAANIVVPDNGSAWTKLRSNDFSDVDADMQHGVLPCIAEMMHSDYQRRPTVGQVLSMDIFQQLARMMADSNTLTGAIEAEPENSPIYSVLPHNNTQAMVID